MSDSVRPHRRQPTRLPSPWDSPGKNPGVSCHFLLQCMKVKSESEVAQSCPTLSDPIDCSLPGSSLQKIFQARVLKWGDIAFSDSNCSMINYIMMCLLTLFQPLIIFCISNEVVWALTVILRELLMMKWKWSRSVVSDSLRPHGLQPTRLLRPWDFPGKSTDDEAPTITQINQF